MHCCCISDAQAPNSCLSSVRILKLIFLPISPVRPNLVDILTGCLKDWAQHKTQPEEDVKVHPIIMFSPLISAPGHWNWDMNLSLPGECPNQAL